MAAISSSTITPSLSINPSVKFTSLSSSSSVFFSYNISNRVRLGLDVDRRHRRAAKRNGFSCNCLFGLGVPELVVIAGVAVLLFGPKQLPEVGRSIGKTVKSFQQAAKEFETELKKDPEPSGEEPSSEKITKDNEEKQQEAAKVPSTKESS